MSNTTSNKRKLLQGASALILGSISVTAVAAAVKVEATGIVTMPSTAAENNKDQLNTGGITATISDGDSDIQTDNTEATTGSSVEIADNLARAGAMGNDAISTITDAPAADFTTSSSTKIEQDNRASGGATSDNLEIELYGNGIETSTFDVVNNTIITSITGNKAAASIALTDYATNDTDGSTMAAFQKNATVVPGGADPRGTITLSAGSDGNRIGLEADGYVTGSSLSIQGNTDTSSAIGNSLTQQMALGGTTLALGTSSALADTRPTQGEDTPGGTGSDPIPDTIGTPDINASGNVVIVSNQINEYAGTSARTDNSRILLDANDVLDIQGSTLDVSGNVQDSNAVGSTVGNAMSLTGVTVGTGAAIVSAQSNDVNSEVSAFTDGRAEIVARDLTTSDTYGGSAISLTDNKIQSRATGGSVSNTMAVSATTMTLQQQDDTYSADLSRSELTSDTSLSGQVSGAFATLNDQLIEGDVSALTERDGVEAAFQVSVYGTVEGSTINNDRNTLSAQAQAAVATNTTTLTIGGSLTENLKPDPLDEDPYTETVANGAVVANLQEIGDAVDVEATVNTVDGDVAVPAIRTFFDDNLDGATVTTSGNKVQAFAEAATSTNTLTVSARTLDVADGSSAAPLVNAGEDWISANNAFAVANLQDGGSGTVLAQLNDSVVINTTVTGVVDGSTVSSTGNVQDAFASSTKTTNTLSLSATTLSGDAGLVSSQTSDAGVTARIGGTDTPDGVVAGDTGENAGVMITLGNNFQDSAVAVTGNMVRGSAVNNSGTNTLTVSATTLSGDGENGQGFYDGGPTVSDYSLLSRQETQSGSSATTFIDAAFGIDQDFDRYLSGSQVSVSNNIQFGEAIGNTATNRLSLTATDAGFSGNNPTAVLNNQQDGLNPDSMSTSNMTAFANAASDGSAITINGNSNTALAVSNNASNTMVVSGVSINGPAAAAVTDPEDPYMTASYGLVNDQYSSSGTVESNASSAFRNADAADTNYDVVDGADTIHFYGTYGLVDGSFSIANNATMSEASSNRVANSLSVTATDSAATAAIGNYQENIAGVTARADGSFSLALEADMSPDTLVDVLVENSTIKVTGNTVTALARGNSASNALNYNFGTTYSGPDTGFDIDGYYVVAQAAIANVQNNLSAGGSILADASSSSFSIGLNAANGASVDGSSVSLSANAVAALAFGNTAKNTMTISNLGSGAPSFGINNDQDNVSNVTARADTSEGTTFSLELDSGVYGSTLSMTGNAVSADAYANSASNAITVTAFGAGDPAAGIGNEQSNSRQVNAYAQNVFFDTSLNETDGDLAVSSVTMSGNTVIANGYANSATNSITMSPLSDGTPFAGIDNDQYNANVVVNADVDNADFTITEYADIDGSTLSMNQNAAVATAMGSSATNTITLSAFGSADPDAYIFSDQTNFGPISARAEDVDFTIGLNNDTGQFDGSTVTMNANAVTTNAYGNSVNNGITLSSVYAGDTSPNISNYQDSFASITASSEAADFRMDAYRDINGSTLSMNGNAVAANAFGNSAANAITLSSFGSADPTVEVYNSQEKSGTVRASAEDTSFYIGLNYDAGTFDGSSVTMNGNTVSTNAYGNSATNSITMSPFDYDSPIAAIANTQVSQDDVTSTVANSDFIVVTESVVSGSSVAMNGNAITANAVANSATNTITMSPFGTADGFSDLENDQDNLGNVYATNSGVEFRATLNADNGEVNGSSVAMNGNTITANGFANSATNVITTVAYDSDTAGALLDSDQFNQGNVLSTVSGGELGIFVWGGLDGSTVSQTGNKAVANAAANLATNTITMTPSGSSNTYTEVINNQTNQGEVAARATDMYFNVTLNDGGGTTQNSTMNLGGNTVAANAVGNSSTNTITMATFGYGIPNATITNNQSNSGPVSASTVQVNFQSYNYGSVNGSSIRNTGNTISAQAIGNSSVSTINGGM